MKSVKIVLPNKFYDKESILEAIKDFKEVCEGKILNEEFEIELKYKEIITEDLENEFSNYVLGLMQNKIGL